MTKAEVQKLAEDVGHIADECTDVAARNMLFLLMGIVLGLAWKKAEEET